MSNLPSWFYWGCYWRRTDEPLGSVRESIQGAMLDDRWYLHINRSEISREKNPDAGNKLVSFVFSGAWAALLEGEKLTSDTIFPKISKSFMGSWADGRRLQGRRKHELSEPGLTFGWWVGRGYRFMVGSMSDDEETLQEISLGCVQRTRFMCPLYIGPLVLFCDDIVQLYIARWWQNRGYRGIFWK